MTTYTIAFDRVGRNHDVPPLTVTTDDENELLKSILAHARPHLGSREVEVYANFDERRGFIAVGGFRNAGSFTIEASE